jgi:DNA-directed RNA polymerase
MINLYLPTYGLHESEMKIKEMNENVQSDVMQGAIEYNSLELMNYHQFATNLYTTSSKIKCKVRNIN